MKNNLCKDQQHHFEEIQSDLSGGENRIICKECNGEKIILDNGCSIIIIVDMYNNRDATR
jgi:hypothetical protein